ncbi:MAG: hypothetical protein WAN65_20630, partial [Candidatus Sulfotelmatobacter sp.]
LPYVFPPDGTRIARSPANRILVDRKYGSSARTMIKESLEMSESILGDDQQKAQLIAALDSHGINESARKAIQAGNLAEFVISREDELRRQENDFLGQYNLSIESSIQRSEDEVDIDED